MRKKHSQQREHPPQGEQEKPVGENLREWYFRIYNYLKSNPTERILCINQDGSVFYLKFAYNQKNLNFSYDNLGWKIFDYNSQLSKTSSVSPEQIDQISQAWADRE